MGDSPSPQDLVPQTGSPQGWPDGWYIYEDGQLAGPLSAAETFARSASQAPDKPLLVSRKGFSQWYPLQDLAEIYQAGKAAADEPARIQPKVMAKRIGPSPKSALAPAAAAGAMTLAGPGALAPRTAASVSAFESSQVPTAKIGKLHAKKAVLQEYFLARSRLRLGRLRNPWLSAFVGAPLSLGIYWPVWYGATEQEMRVHTAGTAQPAGKSMLPAVLAAIPLVHIYMAYRLATQVRKMEAQNKYQYTLPLLAAALAVIPPLAMAYIQHALNRHWLLHAKHLVVKRRAQAA